MQVNIKNLVDDAQCYETVRKLRWSEGTQCACCGSMRIIRRGFDEKAPDKQRYECKDSDYIGFWGGDLYPPNDADIKRF